MGLIFFLIVFIWAVLDLHCCTGFSLVAENRAYFLVAVRGLLIDVTSVVEQGLQGCGLQ